MNKKHFAFKVIPAPAHLSILRLAAICAAVAGIVAGITVWWDSYPASNDVAQHPNSHRRLGAPDAPRRLIVAAQPAEAGSSVTARRFEQQGDLLAAIKRAQATTGNTTLSTPKGQSTWQGMSDKEAAKVFEDAIKVAKQRSSAVTVSPFGSVNQ